MQGNWISIKMRSDRCFAMDALQIIQDAFGIESDHNFSRNRWHLTLAAIYRSGSGAVAGVCS